MSSNINLFQITDSQELYEKFVKLATTDYEELKNQITNHFQQGMYEELREYKINIFAEAKLSENNNDLSLNLVFAISFPLVLLIGDVFSENQINICIRIACLLGYYFLIGIISWKSFMKGKKKNHSFNVSKQKALLFLEQFEI